MQTGSRKVSACECGKCEALEYFPLLSALDLWKIRSPDMPSHWHSSNKLMFLATQHHGNVCYVEELHQSTFPKEAAWYR